MKQTKLHPSISNVNHICLANARLMVSKFLKDNVKRAF